MHANPAATMPRVGFGAMMSTMTEDVWRDLTRGDAAAFRAVFEEHHKAVYNFAFRHTASWAVAEDATQACFTTVWRRAREGSLPDLPHGSARAWLCGVARNECRNLSRGQQRQLRVVGRIDQQPRQKRSNVDDWLAHEDAMRRINEVLGRIPDAQTRGRRDGCLGGARHGRDRRAQGPRRDRQVPPRAGPQDTGHLRGGTPARPGGLI